MALIKHFLVKMRLASSGVLTELNREFACICRLPRNLDSHSQNYIQNLLFA